MVYKSLTRIYELLECSFKPPLTSYLMSMHLAVYRTPSLGVYECLQWLTTPMPKACKPLPVVKLGGREVQTNVVGARNNY